MFDAAVWGTVGQWVSGVGSSGALLLGLTIMLRDRRYRQREQASKVSCWHDMEYEGLRHYVVVSLRNNSDQDVFGAIFDLRLNKKIERQGKEPLLIQGLIAGRIEPGQQKSFRVDTDKRRYSDFTCTMSYKDATGMYWTRNMQTFELKKGESSLPRRLARRVKHLIKPPPVIEWDGYD